MRDGLVKSGTSRACGALLACLRGVKGWHQTVHVDFAIGTTVTRSGRRQAHTSKLTCAATTRQPSVVRTQV